MKQSSLLHKTQAAAQGSVSVVCSAGELERELQTLRATGGTAQRTKAIADTLTGLTHGGSR